MADIKQRIGFIGLGNMGQGFTRRLTDCGYQVTAYDIDADKVTVAAGYGVVPASSPADAARNCDVVHVCVMSADVLESVVFGPDGIASGGTSGQVLVDHSTVPVDTTKALAQRLAAEVGMTWVDAPVSGGPPAATGGTLSIMVGGGDTEIAGVSQILDDLGSWTHMGPVGAGQVTKMVNQVLVLNNICVLAEALTLAEAGGLDAAKIPQALGNGYAGSVLLERLYPRMVARDFEPAAYASIALKDLNMIADLAKTLNVPTPMSSQTEGLYQILTSKGHEQLDLISILKVIDPKEHL
jgi:3-hydroxyisobutyrate dehydrogenase